METMTIKLCATALSVELALGMHVNMAVLAISIMSY